MGALGIADDVMDTETVGAGDGIEEFSFLAAELEPIAVGFAVGVIKGDDVALDGGVLSRIVGDNLIMDIDDMNEFVRNLQEAQKQGHILKIIIITIKNNNNYYIQTKKIFNMKNGNKLINKK